MFLYTVNVTILSQMHVLIKASIVYAGVFGMDEEKQLSKPQVKTL